MKKVKVSIVLNIVNSVFITTFTIFMVLGINFMGSDFGGALTADSINAFQFFTVDSNLLLGVSSLLMAIYSILYLKGLKQEIPKFVYLLKYVGVVSAGLTFLMVVLVLSPAIGGMWWKLFVNSNLFFHLICPVIGIISFVFFERNSKIKFKDTFIGLIPMIIYSIYYSINVFTHYSNGRIAMEHDWYGFAQNGVVGIVLAMFATLVMTYFIAFTIWFANRRKVVIEN